MRRFRENISSYEASNSPGFVITFYLAGWEAEWHKPPLLSWSLNPLWGRVLHFCMLLNLLPDVSFKYGKWATRARRLNSSYLLHFYPPPNVLKKWYIFSKGKCTLFWYEMYSFLIGNVLFSDWKFTPYRLKMYLFLTENLLFVFWRWCIFLLKIVYFMTLDSVLFASS